jgi:hypothetical protein
MMMMTTTMMMRLGGADGGKDGERATPYTLLT